MWTSILSGVAGALTIAGIFYLARIPSDVTEHNRLINARDEDLCSWVADRHVILVRAHRTAIKEMAPSGQNQSGEFGFQLSMLNEAALHEWRDEERAASRFRSALVARETFGHRILRRFVGSAPDLSAISRADALLDQWVVTKTSDGKRIDVDDPRKRSPESVASLDLSKVSG